MTELTNAATVSHPDRARTGAVGTACLGIEVRLARDGEVLVRGPLVMRGYYRDPAGPADALDRTAGCTRATSARWTPPVS